VDTMMERGGRYPAQNRCRRLVTFLRRFGLELGTD
jgi:hypothetical protein